MIDLIMQNYNQLCEQVINGDCCFQYKDGYLCFEGVDLDVLVCQYFMLFYVFFELEIICNIYEIQQVFVVYKNIKIFFVLKICLVMGVLKVICDVGICVEVNL